MKKVFINIQDKITNFSEVYKNAFLDIKEKYNLDIINFYISGNIAIEDLNNLSTSGIKMLEYKTESDILYILNKLDGEIVFINTMVEDIIPMVNNLRNIIGQKTTLEKNLFRNKVIQRKLLLENAVNIGVNYLEIDISSLDYKNISEKLGKKFVIKPSNGVQSAGVKIINNEKDLYNYQQDIKLLLKRLGKKVDINKTIFMAEEFIDGKMFTTSIFVNNSGNIIYTPVVENTLANSLGVDDFFIFSRNITQDTNSIIDKNKFYKFIYDSIKSCGIINTFVHYEFQLNSKGDFKAIELNGRIGGFRLNMYSQAYGYNLFDGIFGKECNEDLKYNISSIAIYPFFRGILESYNYDILSQIKKLPSFNSMVIYPEKYEGKEVGLTKDGFSKLGKIILKNKDFTIFSKDYNFIKNNYKKLLNIKK